VSSAQNAIEAILYSTLTADTAAGKLMTIVSGVYNTVAPYAATYPFVVLNLVDSDDVYTLTQRIRTRYRYQIKCVGKGLDNTVAISAMSRIDTLLNRVTLAVTGYTFWVCERVSGMAFVEENAGVFYQHVSSDFKIEVA